MRLYLMSETKRVGIILLDWVDFMVELSMGFDE